MVLLHKYVPKFEALRRCVMHYWAGCVTSLTCYLLQTPAGHIEHEPQNHAHLVAEPMSFSHGTYVYNQHLSTSNQSCSKAVHAMQHVSLILTLPLAWV